MLVLLGPCRVDVGGGSGDGDDLGGVEGVDTAGCRRHCNPTHHLNRKNKAPSLFSQRWPRASPFHAPLCASTLP